MSSFAWFQDGVGYGGADLATWHDRMIVRGALRHVFSSNAEFVVTSDQGNRTVTVGAGNVLIGGAAGGGTWAWSSGATIAVPTASIDNPRKDLVIARLVTLAADGTNGLAIELIEGTPAAAPQVPARPDKAVALCVLDVPKATTTFTVTAVHTSGAYQDQAALANGHVAISWGGILPMASAFPVGFTLYDFGTNQRWVRRAAESDWFTADPGPWKLCTPQNVQAKDGTNVTVAGSLYVRESSVAWELSGQLNFSPSKVLDQLVMPALLPSGISRPTQNTYTASGQSWNTTQVGTGRLAITTSGAIEWGGSGSTSNVYINAQLTKSPWNT